MTQRLTAVDDASDQDAIITAQSLPALTGNSSEDLLCGGCGAVLAEKLTTDAIASAFRTDDRLLLRCTCGAANLIAERSASLH